MRFSCSLCNADFDAPANLAGRPHCPACSRRLGGFTVSVATQPAEGTPPTRTGEAIPESLSFAEAKEGTERPPRLRLGRYRIVAVLGRGGFGTVYRGRDDDLEREVAIKVPHRVDSTAAADAFLAEARVLARLDHPGIVPVYDVGRTEDGLCYMVSKFIEGSDLATHLCDTTRAPEQAAHLVAHVAAALHYAHRCGFVHRDVKPKNIFLDRAGTPVVGDFGLALRQETFGQGPTFAGTPAYMSPEQARGAAHQVDARSDIYSLGVVFYELLTGQRPFCGQTNYELLGQIRTRDARPPRQLDEGVPVELDRICLKMLARNPEDRYGTASAVAADLRRWTTSGAGPFGTGRPEDPDRVDLRDEMDSLRQELIEAGQRRRMLPREPVVGLRFLDVDASFKDRVEALAQLRRLLSESTTKFVCIVGRGGVGKTALLSKVSAEVEYGELRLPGCPRTPGRTESSMPAAAAQTGSPWNGCSTTLAGCSAVQSPRS